MSRIKISVPFVPNKRELLGNLKLRSDDSGLKSLRPAGGNGHAVRGPCSHPLPRRASWGRTRRQERDLTGGQARGIAGLVEKGSRSREEKTATLPVRSVRGSWAVPSLSVC